MMNSTRNSSGLSTLSCNVPQLLKKYIVNLFISSITSAGILLMFFGSVFLYNPYYSCPEGYDVFKEFCIKENDQTNFAVNIDIPHDNYVNSITMIVCGSCMITVFIPFVMFMND